MPIGATKLLTAPLPSRVDAWSQIQPEARQFRILCIGETWYGSDARAAFAAFRRLGHSVHVLDESSYVSTQWQSTLAKGLRKIFRPLFVNELKRGATSFVLHFKPDCLFVFKGNWVHPEIVSLCRREKIASVNYYPDVSFLTHGSYIPKALPLYDHVFTTKSYGLEDMKREIGVHRSSFLPPGYDPDLHRPLILNEGDRKRYACDVVFIGTWSPKKERLLALLSTSLPMLRVKIWGCQWNKSSSDVLAESIMGAEVTGDEYTKAICGASICLGLLSEAGGGASSGDLITARTFQIPACGAFMLHERNAEVLDYFSEGKEADFFDSPDELAAKVRYYLEHPAERQDVAQAGFSRSLKDDYSIDARMKVVTHWLNEHLRTANR
jgi:spore maturation protein CgeB